MAVEFEWRFDGGASDEQPAEPARRRWRSWLLRGALIAGVLGLVVFVWWRARQAALAQLEQEVQAVAELEVQALLRGDLDLYLSLQDPDDPVWIAAREPQVHVGNILPAPAPGLSATLPITMENPHVVGDRARVEWVRLAGRPGDAQLPFRGVSFYRLAADGRWVHTAPDPDYGGRTLVWTGARNSLAGPIVHAELMERLAPELERTAQAFCEIAACSADTHFTLALTGTLETPADAVETFPAPYLVGAPEGADAEALWRGALKAAAVDTMLYQVVGLPAGGLLGSGLRAWVHQTLGTIPPHPTDLTLLRETLAEGRLVGLDALWQGDVPSDWQSLAEEEAIWVARFVERRYDREGVTRLLEALAEAPSFDALTRSALGVDAVTFEQQWLEYLQGELIQ